MDHALFIKCVIFRACYCITIKHIKGVMILDEKLKVTSVTLTQGQINFCSEKSGNISRYIRSLIDREMGTASRILELLHKQDFSKLNKTDPN